MLDILNGEELYKKVDEMRKKRGWSIYQLAKKAGVSSTTIYNWRDNLNIPSLTLLEAVCNALDVSLFNFILNEKDFVSITEDHKEVLILYNNLTHKQKLLIKDLMKELK